MGKKIQQQVHEESDSESEQYEEQAQTSNFNNEKQMNIKINEIQAEFKKRLRLGQKDQVNWHEHMSLVSDQAMEIEKMDINDDIQREVQFYNIALENAKLAIKYLKSEKIPIRRPDDYFAEMVKTDQQMTKIKNRLVQQQVKVQDFEEKLLRAQSKKLSKKIKARTEFNKHKEKRDNLNAIEEWKKEISNKGEKAKDLSDFLLKKRDFKKDGKKGDFQKGGKNNSNNNNGGKPRGGKPQHGVKRNSGGGKQNNNKKVQKHGKTIQKKQMPQGKGNRGGNNAKRGGKAGGRGGQKRRK